MGELYPPTAADYASADAQDAQAKVKALEMRVAKLEGVMMAVMFRLDGLDGRRVMGSEHGEY